MATVVVPPFWVPRPAEEQYWAPTVDSLNSGAIALTTTQAKIFGQPGQAPTKRWSPYYGADNDPPAWQPLAANLGATNLTLLLGPLDRPPRATLQLDPRSPLTYDETPTWYPAAETLNATILYMPSPSPPRATFQFDWRWSLSFDDTPSWNAAPIAVNENLLAPQTTNIARAPFYAPRPIEDILWAGQPLGLATDPLYLPSGKNPFSNRGWRYDHDDPPPWQMLPDWMNSGAIQLTTTQGKFFGQPGQTPPFRWNATGDDPPVWTPNSDSLTANTLLLSLTSPPRATFSYDQRLPYSYDETPAWTWPGATRNRNVLLPVAQNPFANHRWGWNVDDQPTWQWPIYTATVVPLSMQLYTPSAPISFSYDDPPAWQWPMAERNRNILVPPAPSPFSNRQTWWNNDDPPPWQMLPDWMNSGAIQLTVTQKSFYGQPGQAPPFRWNATGDDPPPWAPNADALTANTLLLSLVSPPRATFSYDQRLPYSYDETPAWTWPGATRNRNVLLPTTPPLVYPPRQWYSEDAFWLGVPTRSQIIQLLTVPHVYGQGGQGPPFRPNFTLDDPPMWQGSPASSAAIPLTTTQQRLYGLPGQVIPRFWAFNYDDASYLNWPTTELNFALLFSIFVPPPPPPAGVVSAQVTVRAATSISTVIAQYSITWVR